MRAIAPPMKQAATERAAKFTSQSDIETRLATLRAMKFDKGQRGIGARDHEIKQLEERLGSMRNPTLI